MYNNAQILNSPGKARILVVDNHESSRELSRDILRQSGFLVEAASGNGDALVREAFALGEKFRPHVALVDLRVTAPSELDALMTDDETGIQIIGNFTQAGANCILQSAFLTTEITKQAIKEFGAYDTIKARRPVQELINVVSGAAKEKCASCRDLDIDWNSVPSTILNFLELELTYSFQSLANDLFAQLFPNSHSVTVKEIGKPSKTSESAARQHSLVLRVLPDNYLIPVIVKIGPAKRMQAETQHYREFVHNGVGRFYAEHKRETIFWDLGATVYVFLGTMDEALPTYATFYTNTPKAQAALKPLEHFFSEVWQAYHNGKKPLEGSLFVHYDSIFNLSSKMDILLSQNVQWPTSFLPDLPHPVQWLNQHYQKSYCPNAHQTITHGDLHSDNLFVDKGGNAWAIDFERTGWGHNVRDFVELEVDLVTRLTISSLERPIEKFFQFCLQLVNTNSLNDSLFLNNPDDESIQKTLQVVNGLRQLAYKLTQPDHILEYWWALLFNTIFAAAIAGPTQRERALIYASVLTTKISTYIE